jgi:hypothetical protein
MANFTLNILTNRPYIVKFAPSKRNAQSLHSIHQHILTIALLPRVRRGRLGGKASKLQGTEEVWKALTRREALRG